MADEVDLRRVERIMLRTALGLDPGVMSPAERLAAKRFIQEAVENWQHAGALPRTQDPLHLTPTDVLNRYRRWAELERLRLDPAIPCREGQTLAALLTGCPRFRRRSGGPGSSCRRSGSRPVTTTEGVAASTSPRPRDVPGGERRGRGA